MQPAGFDSGGIESLQVHERETGGVPDLVAEVAAPRDALLGEEDVSPGHRDVPQGEAQGVGPVPLDDIQGIDDVPG